MRQRLGWIAALVAWSVMAVAQEPVASYRFDEATGDTVHDSAGLEPALDLTVAHPDRVSWSGSGLSILQPTILTRVQAPWRVNQAIRDAAALSLEAWVTPANSTQTGPARVVTLSNDPGPRNLMLGQEGSRWEVRLRTGNTPQEAQEQRLQAQGAAPGGAGRLTHAVYTRSADGQARIYVDGELVAERPITGSLLAWDFGYRFCLANEVEESRTWLGDLQQVAVYELALSPDEVIANQAAGGRLAGPNAVESLALPPVLFYTFEEGQGSVVQDRSGSEPALDLTITDPDRVQWGDGSLSILQETRVLSEDPPLKLISACGASEELTIEAWFAPANLTQGGPSRIVSMSKDGNVRNFTLAQERDGLDVRLRTDATGLNGSGPSTSAPSVLQPVAADSDPVHLVFVREGSGEARLFLNGTVAAEGMMPGSLQAWDDDFRLAVGNEPSRDRPWLGTLHGVALFDHALTGDDVAARHAAGP